MRIRAAFLTLASILCTAATAAPPTRYAVTGATITELGNLGGNQSVALDINDNGEIVGWAEIPTGSRHAFLFRAGMMEDISGFLGASTYDSEASGINRWTRVVGTYRHPSAPRSPHAFHWEGGLIRLMRDAYPADCRGGQGSEAFAISDADFIAGRIICHGGSGGYYEAARWTSPSSYTLLDHATGSWRAPPFTWNNVAYDVNSAGTAVGRTKDIERIVRWRNAPAPNRDDLFAYSIGLDDRGWPDDGGRAINDAGAVVGKLQRRSDGAWRAFYWAAPSATVIDLGVLPGGIHSYGDDLNEQRFIAGSADTNIASSPFVLRRRAAFVYHADFGMFALPALPSSGTGTCEAHAINERNTQNGRVQLAGYCEANAGARRAVRWDVTVSVVATTSPGTSP